LSLLLVVGVHGAILYGAWGLIALAFVSEVAASFVYWSRSRNARRWGA
jgi:hypothetical protein